MSAAPLPEAFLEPGRLAGWLASHGRPGGDVERMLVAASVVALGVPSGWVRGLGVSPSLTISLAGTPSGMATRRIHGKRARGLAPAGRVALVAVLALTGRPAPSRPGGTSRAAGGRGTTTAAEP